MSQAPSGMPSVGAAGWCFMTPRQGPHQAAIRQVAPPSDPAWSRGVREPRKGTVPWSQPPEGLESPSPPSTPPRAWLSPAGGLEGHIPGTLSRDGPSLHRRAGGFLPGPVQHHALPVLQPRRYLLLRQPERQVLLALHHRPAAHDACGRGGHQALHQPLLRVRGPGRCHRRPQPGRLHPPLPGWMAELVDRIFLPHGTWCLPALSAHGPRCKLSSSPQPHPGLCKTNQGSCSGCALHKGTWPGGGVRAGIQPALCSLSHVRPGAAPTQKGPINLPPGLCTALIRINLAIMIASLTIFLFTIRGRKESPVGRVGLVLHLYLL